MADYTSKVGSVTGVPSIGTIDGLQGAANLAQQVSQNWVVAKAFPNDIPALTDIQKGFDSVAQVLVQLLEVVNQILQTAKVFVAAYANPIQTLTKVLIDQIKLLINDIRQIGLYLTSDAQQFKGGWPLNGLRGGYQAYEQRMVARLTDSSDPTRPNVSDSTYVLGMFFYLSVDVTKVYQMLKSIQQLLALFSSSLPSAALPACSTPRVKYGLTPTNLAASFSVAFKNATEPLTIANLEWTIDRPAAGNPILTLPLLPPQGFVIEVSTEPGLALFANRPSPSKGGNVPDSTGNGGEPREVVPVVDSDGKPVLLFGGYDLVSLGAGVSVSTAYKADGALKDGSSFYFLTHVGNKASNEMIPPDKLHDASTKTYYLQRTYKLSQAELFLDPTVGVYRFTLDANDLPHDASFVRNGGTFDVIDHGPAMNYYVRVSSISDEVDQLPPKDMEFALKYNLDFAPNPQGPVAVSLLNQAPLQSQRGKPSTPTRLTFPAKSAKEMLASLRSALALTILLRADLKLYDLAHADAGVLESLVNHKTTATGVLAQTVLPFKDGKGTELELFADTLFPQITQDKVKYYRGNGTTPSAWCSKLVGTINNLADSLYKQMGSLPAVEALLVEKTKELRTLTFAEISEGKITTGLAQGTILSALAGQKKDGTVVESSSGLASSPFQAFDTFGTGALSIQSEDSPYLWYKTPQYTLVDTYGSAENVEKDIASAIASEGIGFTSADAYMASLGFRKGPRDYFGVGTSTTIEYLKLDEKDPQKMLFQTEGFPVLYSSQSEDVLVSPIRTLFDTDTGRKVMEQAQMVLNVAMARQQQGQIKGEWLSLRLGNVMYGGALDKVLPALNQYVKAINNAFASAVQVILEYIDFLQARIRELQRFIKLIDYYVQQIGLFVIPQTAVLLTISAGTQGTLSSFISAKNKPADGPASYGAGAAVVIPMLAGTKFIVDLILAAEKAQAGG